MSEQLEWRRVYAVEGRPGRETVFVRGVARGDYYHPDGTDSDVWRVRFWPRERLQGGAERLVLGHERARGYLEQLAKGALAAEPDE
jgi:hypothetical protein